MTKERVCANGLFVSRRNLIAGGAATSLVGSTSAAAQEVDPILPIYREWWASHLEWNRLSRLPGNGDWDWPESIEAERREMDAFNRMMEHTPISLEGMAAMAHALWAFDGPTLLPSHPEFLEECAQHENMFILQIWRAASGQAGRPPHYTDVLGERA